MLPLALKVLWLVLSVLGTASAWAVLIPFAHAVGAAWAPVLYCLAVTVLQGAFCLGMIWRMDTHRMPHAFCVAQTALMSVSGHVLAGVCASFTAALYLSVHRPQRLQNTPSPLAWRAGYLWLVGVFPAAAFAAYLTVILRLDAVRPSNDMYCDATSPLWPRLLSYAGAPLLLAAPSLVLSSLTGCRIIKMHSQTRRWRYTHASRPSFTRSLPYSSSAAAAFEPADVRLDVKRPASPLPHALPLPHPHIHPHALPLPLTPHPHPAPSSTKASASASESTLHASLSQHTHTHAHTHTPPPPLPPLDLSILPPFSLPLPPSLPPPSPSPASTHASLATTTTATTTATTTSSRRSPSPSPITFAPVPPPLPRPRHGPAGAPSSDPAARYMPAFPDPGAFGAYDAFAVPPGPAGAGAGAAMVDREASALAGLVGVAGARADSDEAREEEAGAKMGDAGDEITLEVLRWARDDDGDDEYQDNDDHGPSAKGASAGRALSLPLS
ncbi:hypothetical protein HETIRDRAFT_390342, partial [Heterobasidion irregulare TC 32-1]